ncbi:hypothetical protein Bbelb_348930 [Branchiostoma belcheri]|nr:hypothetical protein Bbelb_348930 [Branchiostoma belcheri]
MDTSDPSIQHRVLAHVRKSVRAVDVVGKPQTTYSGETANVDLTLAFEQDPEQFYANLRQAWCTDPPDISGDESYPWLTTNNGMVLSDKGRKAATHDVIYKGFSLGAFRGRSTFTCHYETRDEMSEKQLSFEHDRKELTVYFREASPNVFTLDDEYVHRMNISYNDLEKYILVTERKTETAMYLFLKHRVKEVDSLGAILRSFHGTGSLMSLGATDSDIRERAKTTEDGTQARRTRLRLCPAWVFGNASCLKLVIFNESRWNNITHQIISRLCGRCGFKAHYLFTREERALTTPPAEPRLQGFAAVYAMRVLLSRGFSARDQMTPELCLKLEELEREKGEDVVADVLYRIVHIMDQNRFVGISKAFDGLLAASDIQLGPQKMSLPATLRFVRRVIVTPTTLFFLQPEIMFENRMLRDYGEEFFLRVSFLDEGFQKLQGGVAPGNPWKEEDIFARVREVLQMGVAVGDRHYRFLAASNSQLRQHGVWFFADDGENTVESIRTGMGDFSGCRCPATYLARMGQCFSTTEPTVTDVGNNAFEISDITGGYDPVNCKPFCFSDGIGKISEDLAREVSNRTGDNQRVPSAYQIRYAGVKGMLAVDPTLQGEIMQYRKSMNKFRSLHDVIEICATSHPGRLFLNRQVITILSQLGVPHVVFQELQEQRLFELADMFLLETSAAEALSQRAQMKGTPYKRLLKMGVQLTTEPFFHSEIRRRARIGIPPEYGRNMLGVLDETGTLEYGQVFIQYTADIANQDDKVRVLEGEVVVTRTPCLHPGDVRKFQAINVPGLRHMVDVIVFPSKGPRPHPNEMSGGDLDGDEYFVTWYPGLIFNRPNEQPMYFRSPNKREVSVVTISHLIDFIVDYIKNDRLGLIASAHLAFADTEGMGIFSDVCKRLAEKHSDAVDFPKTGVCPNLDKTERPLQYPDFMGKRDKTTRQSERALGKMFRECQMIENVCTQVERRGNVVRVRPDGDLVMRNYVSYVEQARQSRDRYNDQLRSLMAQYGIETEAEAVSGCIVKLHKHMEDRYERYEIERVAKVRIEDLRKRTRQDFFEEFGGEEAIELNHPNIFGKASAWYTVTYSDPDTKLLSFPWVIGDILGIVKTTSTARIAFSECPVIDNITHQLTNVYSSQDFITATLQTLSRYFVDKRMTHMVVQMYVGCYANVLPLVAFLHQWITEHKLTQIHSSDLVFIMLAYAVEAGYMVDLGEAPNGVTREWLSLTRENVISVRTIVQQCSFENSFSLGELFVNFFKYISSHAFKESTAHLTMGGAHVVL